MSPEHSLVLHQSLVPGNQKSSRPALDNVTGADGWSCHWSTTQGDSDSYCCEGDYTDVRLSKPTPWLSVSCQQYQLCLVTWDSRPVLTLSEASEQVTSEHKTSLRYKSSLTQDKLTPAPTCPTCGRRSSLGCCLPPLLPPSSVPLELSGPTLMETMQR